MMAEYGYPGSWMRRSTAIHGYGHVMGDCEWVIRLAINKMGFVPDEDLPEKRLEYGADGYDEMTDTWLRLQEKAIESLNVDCPSGYYVGWKNEQSGNGHFGMWPEPEEAGGDTG